jgi:trans-aconitate methyltransferase
MAAEHAGVSAPERAPFDTEVTPVPDVDEALAETVTNVPPGRALDLGCGRGQNAIWLARQGWTVGGVDNASAAIDESRTVASAFGVDALFEVQDITTWRPRYRYDLVLSTFALPAKGAGRSRMLDMARDAVAPGGMVIIRELDISLGRDGWMSERYLVSTDELERVFDGFRIDRKAVRISRHTVGTDERVLPVATFVATRRTDLRSL